MKIYLVLFQYCTDDCDGEEHEFWWNLTCKTDWYLHDFIELRILEVDPNEL